MNRDRQRDRQIEIYREGIDATTSYFAAVADFGSIFADVFLRERNRKRQIGRERQTENQK